MTKDEALKLALEKFEFMNHVDSIFEGEFNFQINAIKEALAQPTSGDYALGYSIGFGEGHSAGKVLAQPEQEPVAWGVFEGNLHDMFFTEAEAVEMAQLKGIYAEVRPLYTAPQSTWVGLTEKEQRQLWQQWIESMDGWGHFYRAIEANLRSKNT